MSAGAGAGESVGVSAGVERKRREEPGDNLRTAPAPPATRPCFAPELGFVADYWAARGTLGNMRERRWSVNATVVTPADDLGQHDPDSDSPLDPGIRRYCYLARESSRAR